MTGLLYRAYAVFGLPGLPDEFAAGVPRGDDALFGEMVEMMPTLSEADQAKFRPFLVRPTEPDSIFAAQPAAFAGTGPVAQAPPVTTTTCRDWADSGSSDARFKVWACRDTDAAAADAAIATISGLLTEIWPEMTKAEPDGMGSPVPDGYGASVPREYGADARIDFYALDLNQIMYRDGNHTIPATAAAAAIPSPPYTTQDGSPTRTSSGFVLVNRNRLGESLKMKQDVVHEFFHVLQHAHNRRAPFQGDDSHWFSEASAVWAETFFVADSDEPHKWFPAHFQPSSAGLEDPDADHENAAYIWPFFMEQEKGASAVFKAWAAIEPVKEGDFAGVTQAISSQLAFDTSFRDFAMRNLNLTDVLHANGLKHYKEQDNYFYDDKPPASIAAAQVSPGAPYVSAEQSIAGLAARYFEPKFADKARKVTISISQLVPSAQVDGDFLAHYSTDTWKHIPIEGGVLQFCRDDPGWDIDRGYLVVSNHDVHGPVTGHVEIDAKEKCTGDVYLHGTFTGHATGTLDTTDATFDLIIVWHRPIDIQDQLNFELESGTFTFSTTVDGVCGGDRSEGGPLKFYKDNTQLLIYGDSTTGSDYANAGLYDERLNEQLGGIKMGFEAKFDVPTSDPLCEPPEYGYVAGCPLVFKMIGQDAMETSATCEDSIGTTWTGHIVEQSGP